ncbi:MAG: hypothetical protein WCJ80_09380 [Bacteroidota bacterium]
MKNSLLFTLLGLGLFVTSCSTAYKSDQTPDDVYYSPGRPAAERVDIVKDQTQRDQYENYVNNTDEQFLRMKVGNYYRWNMLDDYSYWNDSRYDFSHFNYYSSIGYSNYYGHNNWNFGWGTSFFRPNYSWGNPYYTLVTYYNPKTSVGRPSESGISAYKNKNYTNTNTYYSGNAKSSYNNSNYTTPTSNNFSNLVKKVFSSSSPSGSYDRAARSFDNSSSSNRTSSNSTYSAPSSSAGGTSGGVKSSGTSASSGRTTRN